MTKNLTAQFTLDLSLKYARTDLVLTNDFRDYIKQQHTLTLSNGTGTEQADILFHTRETIDGFKNFPLESLIDGYNQLVDINALKAIFIKNRNTENGVIHVTCKRERYVIGPQGIRFIWEPSIHGVIYSQSESSQEDEGSLYIQCEDNEDVEIDLILVGSSREYSSSSSESGDT
ncbi:MAG: hypothetical protein ACP5N7_03740 [Candidatus Pacearchaeota archaeon]